MKISFIKDQSTTKNIFQHLYQVEMGNNIYYYFIVIAEYRPSPIFEENGKYIIFDIIEAAQVALYVSDVKGTLCEMHPVQVDLDLVESRSCTKAATYEEAWGYLYKYYSELEKKIEKMNGGNKFIPYLEKRIEMMENQLRDKTIVITNQDNRDLDVYMVGKLDACQELLNQIKDPAFYL